MNKFQEAIKKTCDISNGYENGLKALGNHSNKINAENNDFINGSVDIDKNTKSIYPNCNRWDYAISYNYEVYFIEVHPACTSEVQTVLDKLNWLKDWLKSSAPEINKLKAKSFPYIWLFTKRFNILKTSSKYRILSKNGLKPIKKLNLPNNNKSIKNFKKNNE